MNIIKIISIIFIFTFFYHSISAADYNMPDQAFVETRNYTHGQALLINYLDECYAIIPQHVIGNDIQISLRSSGGIVKFSDGDVIQSFNNDLSLSHIKGYIAKYYCNTKFTKKINNLDDFLKKDTLSMLVSINKDGSISRRKFIVSSVDPYYLWIRPFILGEDDIVQGLSGSLLVINDKPAGVLLSTDQNTGEGRVLRYDRIMESISPFFSSPFYSEGQKDITRENILELEAIDWNNPSFSPELGANNLTDNNNSTYWNANINSFPVDIVFGFKSKKVHVINYIKLSSENIENKNCAPRVIEILSSNSLKDSWISVASFTYFPKENQKTINLNQIKSKKIKIRIYSNWGDEQRVCLSKVDVFSK